MSSVILKELSNQDTDWMLATGERVEIAPGTVLVEQGQTLDALYILLDGALTVTLNQENADPLGRAFAVLEGGIPVREIAHLEKGEIIGVPLFENSCSSTTVCARKKSSVLMIPNGKLIGKLHQDLDFAAHLYRAFAVMLANRLQQMMQELGRSTIVLSKPQLREALIIFSELHDSDIDWLIAAGQIEVFPSGSVLIRSGRPTEALYILLDGAVALNACEDDGSNVLARAFSNLEDSKNQPLERLQLQKNSKVISDYTGTVLELTAKPGQQLEPGIGIGTVSTQQSGAKLVNIVFLPVSENKKIKIGTPLQITPSTVKREEFGGIEAKVTKISQFPVTQQGVASIIGNPDILPGVLDKGPQIAVYTEPQIDPSTPSGYKWSSSSGQQSSLAPGTTTTVRITVEEKKPIEFVLPILKSWTGN